MWHLNNIYHGKERTGIHGARGLWILYILVLNTDIGVP